VTGGKRFVVVADILEWSERSRVEARLDVAKQSRKLFKGHCV
jgi:hypothetical protein